MAEVIVDIFIVFAIVTPISLLIVLISIINER